MNWFDPSKVPATSTTTCTHPQHNPPTIVCAPTVHMKGQCAGCSDQPSPFVHRCPACGYGFIFAVGQPS